jgi:hypothetical protein
MKKRTPYLNAGIVAFFLAMPFILCASSFASSNDPEGLLFLGAYYIFMLGFPLTILPQLLGFRPVFGSQGNVWILVSVTLFIIQWLIWSQLLVWTYRKYFANPENYEKTGSRRP